MKKEFKLVIVGCFCMLVTLMGLASIWGCIFMLLWNWLAPLFWTAAPHLSFFESCGIIFLFVFITSLFNYKSK